MWLIISRIRNKFEANGSAYDVQKNRSIGPRILTTPCEEKNVDGKFAQKSKNPIEMFIAVCDSI